MNTKTEKPKSFDTNTDQKNIQNRKTENPNAPLLTLIFADLDPDLAEEEKKSLLKSTTARFDISLLSHLEMKEIISAEWITHQKASNFSKISALYCSLISAGLNSSKLFRPQLHS